MDNQTDPAPPPYAEQQPAKQPDGDSDSSITKQGDNAPTDNTPSETSNVLSLKHSNPFGDTIEAIPADEEFEDETLVERLVGLTEMFPESFRQKVWSLLGWTVSGTKVAYSLSRKISWFLASTATICFLPLFLELERVQSEEQEAAYQRSMMLGPKAVSGGSGLAGFSAVPHLTHIEPK